ncbi:MAG: sel1 repeat family protein, partial [Deltaproteobacteria bacterium]|nr:sel1 repeat family protein [Deltaproteobacteria bacterium]
VTLGALALLALPLCATCGGSQLVYRGDPSTMHQACERAKTVCPPDADWMKCHDDQWECYRLGLWYEDGIKVTRSAARASEIFNTMCDRLDVSSCGELCDDGHQARCVDRALLAVAAAGGAPYPPSFEPYREAFEKGCKQEDVIACMMLDLDYLEGVQPVVRMMNDCFDDRQNCIARACAAGDPLGCAVLCHVGQSKACNDLAVLVFEGEAFPSDQSQRMVSILETRCFAHHDAQACTVAGVAHHLGKGPGQDHVKARMFYEAACPAEPIACSNLATLHADGLGVDVDPFRAANRFEQACTGGYPKACAALAIMFLEGRGVARDRVKARGLLQQACDDGYERACVTVAEQAPAPPAEPPSEGAGSAPEKAP